MNSGPKDNNSNDDDRSDEWATVDLPDLPVVAGGGAASSSSATAVAVEDLMFNIPLKPVVSLTGKVVLVRDETGYITSYQEFWDQDTWSVLKTAKF